MDIDKASVAVLMATYNGAKYVQQQIQSLTANTTRFTLHWIDDHSTDNTREVVRETCASAGVHLVEWHQASREGVPATFFHLLECAEADIYLFSDQDDIWQPGKIDAAVADLLPDLQVPTFSFSDPLLFNEDQPDVLRPWSEVMKIGNREALVGAVTFIGSAALGQSIAFTRPLREIYLRHKAIARAHAYMHSYWLCLVANAVGKCRPLNNVPVTLYRQHRSNVLATNFKRTRGLSAFRDKWRILKFTRRKRAHQALGFILAAPTMPPGPNLERMLAVARIVATFDRRQPLTLLFQLMRHRALPLSYGPMFMLLASCLSCDAREEQRPVTVTTPQPEAR